MNENYDNYNIDHSQNTDCISNIYEKFESNDKKYRNNYIEPKENLERITKCAKDCLNYPKECRCCVDQDLFKVKQHKFLADITKAQFVYYEVIDTEYGEHPDLYFTWLKLPKNSIVVGLYHENGDEGIEKWKKENIQWKEILNRYKRLDSINKSYEILKKEYTEYWKAMAELKKIGLEGAKAGRELKKKLRNGGKALKHECQHEIWGTTERKKRVHNCTLTKYEKKILRLDKNKKHYDYGGSDLARLVDVPNSKYNNYVVCEFDHECENCRKLDHFIISREGRR